VDKIDQFAAELGNPATNAPEQFLALKFLLHFVGDVHQPLTPPTITTLAGTRSLSRLEGCTPATFIATGMSSSWSGWELTHLKLRRA
jgi:hypothetical protein